MKKDLQHAQILARFADASPKQIDLFRQKYALFLPYSWWDTPVSPTFDARLLWSPNQVAALVAGRPANEVSHLGPTMEPSDKPWMLWRVAQFWVRCLWEEAKTETREHWITTKLLGAAWDTLIHSGPTISTRTKFSESQKQLGTYVARLFETPARPSSATILEHPIPIGCAAGVQAAVTFLAHELWRARKCRQCQARFVAAHQGQKFCGTSCSQAHQQAVATEKRERLRKDQAWAAKEKKRKLRNWHRNKGKYTAQRSQARAVRRRA